MTILILIITAIIVTEANKVELLILLRKLMKNYNNGEKLIIRQPKCLYNTINTCRTIIISSDMIYSSECSLNEEAVKNKDIIFGSMKSFSYLIRATKNIDYTLYKYIIRSGIIEKKSEYEQFSEGTNLLLKKGGSTLSIISGGVYTLKCFGIDISDLLEYENKYNVYTYSFFNSITKKYYGSIIIKRNLRKDISRSYSLLYSLGFNIYIKDPIEDHSNYIFKLNYMDIGNKYPDVYIVGRSENRAFNNLSRFEIKSNFTDVYTTSYNLSPVVNLILEFKKIKNILSLIEQFTILGFLDLIIWILGKGSPIEDILIGIAFIIVEIIEFIIFPPKHIVKNLTGIKAYIVTELAIILLSLMINPMIVVVSIAFMIRPIIVRK